MRNNQYANQRPSNSTTSYANVKVSTKAAVKKLAPFLLTGLAAIVEHHWLKKEHSSSSESVDKDVRPKDRHGSSRDESGVQEIEQLRGEVEQLRRERRQSHGGEESHPNLVREERVLREEQSMPREPLSRDPFVYEERIPPCAPTPPFSYPAPFSSAAVFPELRPRARRNSLERYRARYERRYVIDRKRHRRRRRHHRRGRERDGMMLHAAKIAALTGVVEALNVADVQGDWVGERGVRVGTAAAAGFGAVFKRDGLNERVGRERGGGDGREVRDGLVDVGTGLLVSRLVNGPVRRRQERRWSWWY